MSAEIPKVRTLEYIAPSLSSTREEVLEYPKVSAEDGSLEELDAARQQAFQ